MCMAREKSKKIKADKINEDVTNALFFILNSSFGKIKNASCRIVKLRQEASFVFVIYGTSTKINAFCLHAES